MPREMFGSAGAQRFFKKDIKKTPHFCGVFLTNQKPIHE